MSAPQVCRFVGRQANDWIRSVVRKREDWCDWLWQEALELRISGPGVEERSPNKHGRSQSIAQATD